MMRTTATRDCVSRYPALFKSDNMCLEDFELVIMKIIINKDGTSMAVGRQELCEWGGPCRADVFAEKRNYDKRLHIVPGEHSVH